MRLVMDEMAADTESLKIKWKAEPGRLHFQEEWGQ